MFLEQAAFCVWIPKGWNTVKFKDVREIQRLDNISCAYGRCCRLWLEFCLKSAFVLVELISRSDQLPLSLCVPFSLWKGRWRVNGGLGTQIAGWSHTRLAWRDSCDYCVTVGKMSVRYKPSHLSLDSHSNYGQRRVIYTNRWACWASLNLLTFVWL